MRMWLASLLVVLMTGCSLLSSKDVDSPGVRLKEVVRSLPNEVEVPVGAHAEISAGEVLESYRNLLTRVDDPQLRAEIVRRAAELETRRVSELVAQGQTPDISPVIEELSAALEVTSHGPLRYRLAQMLELGGDPDALLAELGEIILTEGTTERALEARFRRAEMYFSRGDYALASADYAEVLRSDSDFAFHAGYMHGWSEFKQGSYNASLDSLFLTIDTMDGSGEVDTQQELLLDTERVMVLTLDYLDGPETLATAMAERSRPEWQARAWRALGSWYRDKERFTDSARTWEVFLDENPLDINSPDIVLEIIDTHLTAGFVEEIPRWERRFVDTFDRDSEFQATHGTLDTGLTASLREFMERLISGQHAAAQTSGLSQDYLLAAEGYRRWLRNFGSTAEAAENHFLLAETLEDAGELREATIEYQIVADTYPETGFAREASWAVVTNLREIATSDARGIDERAGAAWRFALRYPEDERALPALVDAGSMLFEAGDIADALAFAESALIARTAGELRQTAMLVAAHSRFEIADFAIASGYYRELLSIDPEDGDLRSRLLASVFSEAQAFEIAGDIPAAIQGYLSLREIDPASQLAVDARFDVAQLRETSGDLAGAASDLEAFRTEYPGHAGAADIPLRLVGLYEQSGETVRAATELVAIHDAGVSAPELRRLSLYRAGELWLDASRTDEAIKTFRRYAHGYEEPFDIRLEAMHHMDELYLTTGEEDKRRFWLRKKLATVSGQSSAERTQRARFLAADAALQLADAERATFESVSLTLPLDKSLTKKQKAMKASLERYQQAADFEVADIKSAATLAMAGIYTSLANSLMESSRPGGLNELELSQYELLLEEQAFPFEEKAIELHEANLRRGWNAGFDESIDASLTELRAMVPGRFSRPALEVAHANSLY